MTTPTDLGPYPAFEGYDEAVSRDTCDPLQGYRDHFVITDPELIYLDGNSLGRLPKSAVSTIETVLGDQWGDRLIRSWNEGWWDLQLRLGDRLAPLIGAGPSEVIVSDSTTVNLFKLAFATLQAAPGGRDTIVTDDLNFPSDVYILDGVARHLGGRLRIVESDGVHGPLADIAEAVDERTALVSLSHTVFQSGYTYDLSEVTRIAHEAGAMMLWDLSHSVGTIPIDVETSEVDLAVGCTYKYLNGGPGSPAFLYVRSQHQERLGNPITGWWGHIAPFQFELEFRPVTGIRRFHSGTMPILSLAAIEAGLDDVLAAGIDAIRAKSVGLTDYLVDQIQAHLEPLGFRLASPADPLHRGSHVSVAHETAWPITLAMIERAKVIPDYRTPDNIRLGVAPLYTRFIDIHTAILRIHRIVESGAHHEFVGTTAQVT